MDPKPFSQLAVAPVAEKADTFTPSWHTPLSWLLALLLVWLKQTWSLREIWGIFDYLAAASEMKISTHQTSQVLFQSGEAPCKPKSVSEQAVSKSPPLPSPSPNFGCTDRLSGLQGKLGRQSRQSAAWLMYWSLLTPFAVCMHFIVFCWQAHTIQHQILTHTCCCPRGFVERAVLQLLHFPPVKLTVTHCVELLGEGEQSSLQHIPSITTCSARWFLFCRDLDVFATDLAFVQSYFYWQAGRYLFNKKQFRIN